MFSIARKNPAARFSFAVLTPGLCAILLSFALARYTLAQEPASPHAPIVTPLPALLEEAAKYNPQIETARQGWQAANPVPARVSTLTNPEFTPQHSSAARPPPLSGYTD